MIGMAKASSGSECEIARMEALANCLRAAGKHIEVADLERQHADLRLAGLFRPPSDSPTIHVRPRLALPSTTLKKLPTLIFRYRSSPPIPTSSSPLRARIGVLAKGLEPGLPAAARAGAGSIPGERTDAADRVVPNRVARAL